MSVSMSVSMHPCRRERMGTLAYCVEAYRCLVALPVFKTGVAEQLGLAGSIPVRLRQPLSLGCVEELFQQRARSLGTGFALFDEYRHGEISLGGDHPGVGG